MNYIERNEFVGFGQPVIIGRRLTVYTVVSYANFPSTVIDEFLKEFELSIDELWSAVFYCKNKVCENILRPSEQYCYGCILRSIDDGWKLVKGDFEGTDRISFSKNGKVTFSTVTEDLKEGEFGKVGWLLAEEVEMRLNNENKL